MIQSVYIGMKNQNRKIGQRGRKKIKDIFTQIVPICQELKKDVHQSDKDWTLVNTLSTKSNELYQSFMYS